MWKNILLVYLTINLAFADEVVKSSDSVQPIKQLNSTQLQKTQISANSSAISKNNSINKNAIEEKNNIGKGSAELINKEQTDDNETFNEVDDGLDFKYYWLLLVFSSCSIISIIVFKSFR